MLRRRAFCGRAGYRSVQDAERFLQPKLEDLHDPFLLRDMDRAAARLREAISRKEKILLYGDYDVDGTTSIVILKKALDLAGATSEFFVPHRMRDGYGMRPEVIDRAASEGVVPGNQRRHRHSRERRRRTRSRLGDRCYRDGSPSCQTQNCPLPLRLSTPIAGIAPIPKRTFAAPE